MREFSIEEVMVLSLNQPAAVMAGSALSVALVGADGALWHSHDDRKLAWEDLGGALTSGPAVCSWGAGRIDVFARGTDNALWHKWFDDNTWSTWESLGGVLSSAPTAVSWGSGRIDVFARGTDNALWHRWFQDGWQPWESLGGVLSSAPAAASWSAGRIDVFARGADNALWHRWFQDGWQAWESLGGVLSSAPAAASWAAGRIDVVARGTDNALWHRWFQDGWQPWESLGGVLSSSPSEVSQGAGRLTIYARGADGSVNSKRFDNGWSAWQSLGPVDPMATSTLELAGDRAEPETFALVSLETAIVRRSELARHAAGQASELSMIREMCRVEATLALYHDIGAELSLWSKMSLEDRLARIDRLATYLGEHPCEGSASLVLSGILEAKAAGQDALFRKLLEVWDRTRERGMLEGKLGVSIPGLGEIGIFDGSTLGDIPGSEIGSRLGGVDYNPSRVSSWLDEYGGFGGGSGGRSDFGTGVDLHSSGGSNPNGVKVDFLNNGAIVSVEIRGRGIGLIKGTMESGAEFGSVVGAVLGAVVGVAAAIIAYIADRNFENEKAKVEAKLDQMVQDAEALQKKIDDQAKADAERKKQENDKKKPEEDDKKKKKPEGGKTSGGWDSEAPVRPSHISPRTLKRLLGLQGPITPKGPSDKSERVDEVSGGLVPIEVLISDPALDPSPEAGGKIQPPRKTVINIDPRDRFTSDDASFGGNDQSDKSIAGMPEIGGIGGIDPKAAKTRLFTMPALLGEESGVSIDPKTGRIRLGKS